MKQNLTSAILDTNNVLTIDIENGDSVTVDLSKFLDNTDAQTISRNGDTISLSNGGFIVLPPNTVNTDEQNLTSATLDSNNILTIDIENGDSVTVDLSKFLDDTNTDEQNLTSAVIDSNNVLTIGIENGDSVTVDLSKFLDDTNTDQQQLSRNGDTIYLTNGGYVILPPGVVDTDEQNLTSAILDTNNVLTIDIENGDSVTVDLSKFLDNTDAQTISRNGDTISLSNGGFIVLPPNTVNTDEQNLTSATLDSNNILTIDIENGDSVTVDLSKFLDDTNTDEQNLTSAILDSNNVLTIGIENGDSVTVDLSKFLDDTNTDQQQLSRNGDTIYLTNGGYVILPPGVVDTDEQNLTSAILDTNNVLTIDIENGDSVTVDLSKFLDNTDAQTISRNGDTISLSNGGFIVLPPNTVNTDEQNLTSATLDSNNILTIDIENGDSVTVDLSKFLDDTNTDEQNLTSAVLDSNNVLTIGIENGDSVTVDLSKFLDDTNTDQQQLSRSGDTIYLTNGGYVILPPGVVDTDEQNLTSAILDTNNILTIDIEER